MKTKYFIYFFLLPIYFFFSCNDGGGCDFSPVCVGASYGTYYTNDSTKYWLHDKIDSIKLYNSNGFETNINYNLLNNNLKLEFTSRNENYSRGKCSGRTLSCQDYFYIKQTGWKYSSNDLNLNISVYRQPIMSINNTLFYKPDSSELYSKGDMLVAEIGNRIFSTYFSDAIFFNTIDLKNIRFDSVYEVTNSTYYTNSLYAVKAYFKKDFGLVGYVLSNDEVWKLEKK
jgi:hypothetical protein